MQRPNVWMFVDRCPCLHASWRSTAFLTGPSGPHRAAQPDGSPGPCPGDEGAPGATPVQRFRRRHHKGETALPPPSCLRRASCDTWFLLCQDQARAHLLSYHAEVAQDSVHVQRQHEPQGSVRSRKHDRGRVSSAGLGLEQSSSVLLTQQWRRRCGTWTASRACGRSSMTASRSS